MQPPVADFSASQEEAFVGESIQFINNSTGDIESYYWDFGDGETSSEKNASHTYFSPGNYIVYLSVSNQQNSDDKKINIIIHEPLKADFFVSSTVVKTQEKIQFTSNSTGNISSYLWDFGDLTATSTEANPSHVYTRTGNFTVTLKVSDERGSDNKTMQIRVLREMKAYLSASTTKAKAGVSIQFSDMSIGEGDAWLWDFGDGSTSNEKNPIHLYEADGIYTVTLTVSNAISSNTIVEENYITIASLNLKLVMCSSVNANGTYTPVLDATFNRNQQVYLVIEVRDFQQNSVSGGFETWLIWQSLKLYTPGIATALNIGGLPETHQVAPASALYVVFQMPLGSLFINETGEYRVEVKIVDQLSGNIGVESTTFIIE